MLATIGISIEEILAGLDSGVDVELAARAVLDGLAAAGIVVPAQAQVAATATSAAAGTAALASDSDGSVNGCELPAVEASVEAEAAVIRREVDVLDMRDELQRALALTELDASRDEAAAVAEEEGGGEDEDEEEEDSGDDAAEERAGSDSEGGPPEFCRLRAEELLEVARRELHKHS